MTNNILGIDFSKVLGFGNETDSVKEYVDLLKSGENESNAFARAIKNCSKETQIAVRNYKDTDSAIIGLSKSMNKASTASKVLNSAINIGIVAAIAGIAVVVSKTWDKINVTVKEVEESIDTINSKISELNGEIEELENVGYRNEAQQKRLDLLNEELNIQKELLDIEEKRRAKELVGNKFTDLFDENNINTQYMKDAFGVTKNGFASFIIKNASKGLMGWVGKTLIEDSDSKPLGLLSDSARQFLYEQGGLSNTVPALNSQYKEYKDLLEEANKSDKLSLELSDRINNSKKNLLNTISLVEEERLRYLENINALQQEINNGNIEKDSDEWERSQKIIEYYQSEVNALDNILLPIQKEMGMFDFSDSFSGVMDNFNGVEQQLLDLYNSGDLTQEKLEELFNGNGITNNLSSILNDDIIEALKQAGLKASEVYRIIQNIADPQKAWRDNTQRDFVGLLYDKEEGRQFGSYREAKEAAIEQLKEAGLDFEDETVLQAFLDVKANTPDGTYEYWSSGTWIRKIQEQLNQNPIEVKGEFDIPKFSSDTEIFEGLQSLYGSFRENVENGKLKNPLDIGDVQGLDDSLKALDSFKEFQETVLNGNSTVDEVQKAFDKLATEYANTKFQVDEITDANKDLIASQMELDGITKESARNFTNYYSNYNKVKDFDVLWSEENVKKQLTEYGVGGNVDLTLRPQIDTSDLERAGWEDVGEGIATTFTNTFTNMDWGDVVDTEIKAFNFTPILPNGSVLTPDTLNRYAHDVITGVREDNLHLQIGASFDGDSLDDAIQKASEVAEMEHILQEQFYTGQVAAEDFMLSVDGTTISLADEAEQLGITTNQLALYLMQKQLEQPLNTSEDIAMLAALANMAGVAGDAIAELESLKAQYDAATDTRGKSAAASMMRQLQSKIQNEVNNALNVELNLNPTSPKDAGGAGKEAGDAYVEAFEKELSKLDSLKEQGKITEKQYLDYLRAN